MATEFPAFLKLEYERDPTTGQDLLRDVDTTFDRAEKRFKEFSVEANRLVDVALGKGRSAGGALDLGVPELEAAARAQQQRAAAARELAQATALAAHEEQDYSQKARLSVAATEALAVEEEQAAKAALSRAAAAQQVQERLNRLATANDNAIAGTERFNAVTKASTVSVGAFRAGTQQLSFQIGDIAQGLALGISPMTIFAQQAGQTVQAITLMKGEVGGLIGFLGSPWGSVVIGAATILGTTLIPKLFETEDAMKKVEFASYQFGDAQSQLGNVIDLATGKIQTQSAALLGLAKAQAIAGEIQARSRQQQARGALVDEAAVRPHITGGFGGGLSVKMGRNATGDIASAVLDGSLNTKEAVNGLDSLRRTGFATEKQFLKTAQAVAAFGVEAENIAVFEKLQKALDGDKGALQGFLTPPKTQKPKADHTADKATREAERLAKFSDTAADKIASIADKFSDIPPAVKQANDATRELDGLIDDLSKKRPKGFEALVAQAEKLKQIFPDLQLDRAIDQMGKKSAEQLQVDQLILAGRDREAAVLQTMLGLEDRYGAKVRDRRGEVEQIVTAQLKANEALKRAQETQQAYLGTTQSVRTELENLFSGQKANFGQVFKRLTAQITVENIFGDALRKTDRQLKSKFDIGTEALKQQADAMRTSFGHVEQAAEHLAGVMNGIGPSGLIGANDNPTPFDLLSQVDPQRQAAADQNIILAIAKKPDFTGTAAGLTPGSYADMLFTNIATPLLRDLPPAMAKDLAPILGGAIGGYVSGGAVGGFLGGVKGIDGAGEAIDKLTGTTDTLGKALKGAGTGTIVSGIGNAIGLKLNSTGAQIGGSIGSFIPIPGGDIIGSIAGGLLGNLFGKRPRGAAEVSNSSVYAHTNDAALTSATNDFGGSIQQSIKQIADALGVSVGNYSIGLGRYKEYYQVSSKAGDPRLGNSYFHQKSPYSLYDGTDPQAAAAAAIAEAIAQGAIKGLSATAQRILKNTPNIDQAVQNVLDFQGVFTKLKSYKDPVGAALDDLDKQFSHLRDIFAQAGASTEEYAKLEELYGIERAKAIKDATQNLIGPIQSLLDNLTIGDSGLSLRDRQANAQTKYDALSARVQAGDTTAYSDYATAAQSLLDIERQLYGSTQAYFDTFNEVKNVSQGIVDQQQALIDQSASNNSGADLHVIKDGLDSQTNILGGKLDDLLALRGDIANLNDNLITIGRQLGTGVGGGNLADLYGLRTSLSAA